jgi:hypothetical protein
MNPTPPRTPSIAELRTWLLELSQQLTDFERTLAKAHAPTRRTRCLIGPAGSPSERAARLHALRVRLALISELLTAADHGAALVPPEQQLLELMIRSSIDRLASMKPAPPSLPSAGPELPLE